MKNNFILILLLSVSVFTDCKSIFAQQRISESFEGNEFPPAGWSVINNGTDDGVWKSSFRNSKTGNKCAVSNFSSGSSNNILVSKSFTSVIGDSLIFYFRQTFWNNYKDTLNVLISSSDSLLRNSQIICQLKDSVSYPVPLGYGRMSLSLNSFAGQKIWIGFQHINSDGENIRIDDISAGQPGFTEVGVVNNLYPSGVLTFCTFDKIIPKALIKNSGTIDQTIPFNITYSITGPVNYISIDQTTVSSGEEKIIIFDTIQSLEPGNYNVRIYTYITGDMNPLNDTLFSSFSIVNNNYGGGLSVNGNYFFANSSSCSISALSHPEFCWKDTSGSTSLISDNRYISDEFLTGDIDNGYFCLGSFLTQGKKIKFFGNEYDSVFISTNGIIGFTNNYVLLSSDPDQIEYFISQTVPAFCPLWMDLDFSNAEVTGSRLSYKTAGNQLIITFDKAPQRSGGSSDYVSFQVTIEIGESMTRNSSLLVQYNEKSTGENFISKYNKDSLESHLVGMKNVFGNNYLLYRYQDSSGVKSKGPIFNSSMALEFGPDASGLNYKCSEFEISLLLQAIYPRRDTVTVFLRDSESPFEVLESRTMFTDTSGKVKGIFTIPSDIYRYYLQIEHRNSIETWSRINGEIFDSYRLDYDFTSDITMAYGNNMIMKNGRSYIYCGDVNRDGIADGDDLIRIFNEANLFSTGYLQEDIDNNNSVDLDDVVYLLNNSTNFISKITP